MFPMRHDVAERQARKKLAANRVFVPEDERCACLRCGGLARMQDGGPGFSRNCLECGFIWAIEKGNVWYENNKQVWTDVPEGLLPVWWEMEYEEI